MGERERKRGEKDKIEKNGGFVCSKERRRNGVRSCITVCGG